MSNCNGSSNGTLEDRRRNICIINEYFYWPKTGLHQNHFPIPIKIDTICITSTIKRRFSVALTNSSPLRAEDLLLETTSQSWKRQIERRALRTAQINNWARLFPLKCHFHYSVMNGRS